MIAIPNDAVQTASNAVEKAAPALDQSLAPLFTFPTKWPSLIETLEWCQHMRPGTALILIAIGFIFLVYGNSFHRVLISLNAAIIGAWIGGLLGSKAGATLPGVFIGGFLCGAIAWPLLKYAVALVSAVIGFVIGASVWRTCGFEGNYAPAGGLIGMTFLTMLGFITFRTAIILATGLQGASMFVFGALGMMYKYEDITPRIDSVVKSNQYILLLAVLVPAFIGVIYQHSSSTATPAKK